MKQKDYVSLRKTSEDITSRSILHFRSKNAMTANFIIGGGIIVLACLAWMKQYAELTMVLGLMFLFFIAYINSGVSIDTKKKRYKNYAWLFGVKLGFWQSLEDYPDLILLRRNKKVGSNNFGLGNYMMADEGAGTSAGVHYELSFASRNHLEYIPICKYEGKEKAYEDAHTLEIKMECELVQYNPGMRNPRKKLS